MSKFGIAPGTIIHNQYKIERVLGAGGFGITYLARNCKDDSQVALKEYFPVSLVFRSENSCELKVLKKNKEKEFLHGRQRFLECASILMEYSYLEGIVKVWDYFECNYTAYLVMDYIDGITLKEYISSHGNMEYEELISLISPIIKSLVTLHKHDVIHRDISPDNLMIGMDNQLYLIDFGAAKEVAPGADQSNTILLKAGFAPPEQYLHDGHLGAWTDVYALCATIYTALCGKIPTDAVARLQGKELIPLSDYHVTLKDWQWNAIVMGMHMREAERFRNMGELYDALTIKPLDEDIHTVTTQVSEELRQKLETISKKPFFQIKRFHTIELSFILLVVVLFFGYVWIKQDIEVTNNKQNEQKKEEITHIITTTEQPTTQKATTTQESNKKLCSMPNVIGMTQDKAISAINSMDTMIKININHTYHDTVAAGTVIEQNVEPNTQYNEGAIKEIILTISDGKQPVTKKSPSSQQNKTTTKKNPSSQQSKPATTENSSPQENKKDKTESDSNETQSDENELTDFYLDD